jgi:hypothetical protein
MTGVGDLISVCNSLSRGTENAKAFSGVCNSQFTPIVNDDRYVHPSTPLRMDAFLELILKDCGVSYGEHNLELFLTELI